MRMFPPITVKNVMNIASGIFFSSHLTKSSQVPPTLEEQLIIHNLFINTVDHRGFSFKVRLTNKTTIRIQFAGESKTRKLCLV